MTAKRTMVPEVPGMDQSLYYFLDDQAKAIQRASDLEPLDGGASTADVVAKVNALIEALKRTR